MCNWWVRSEPHPAVGAVADLHYPLSLIASDKLVTSEYGKSKNISGAPGV